MSPPLTHPTTKSTTTNILANTTNQSKTISRKNRRFPERIPTFQRKSNPIIIKPVPQRIPHSRPNPKLPNQHQNPLGKISPNHPQTQNPTGILPNLMGESQDMGYLCTINHVFIFCIQFTQTQ
jgi:hypothetical protein